MRGLIADTAALKRRIIMLGEIFGFMNSCFPDQKLMLKVGNVSLGEEEIKALEKKAKEKREKDAAEQALKGGE